MQLGQPIKARQGLLFSFFADRGWEVLNVTTAEPAQSLILVRSARLGEEMLLQAPPQKKKKKNTHRSPEPQALNPKP